MAPTRPKARARLLPMTMMTMAVIMVRAISELVKVREWTGRRVIQA